MYNFQSTGFQLSYFCLVRVKKKLPVFWGRVFRKNRQAPAIPGNRSENRPSFLAISGMLEFTGRLDLGKVGHGQPTMDGQNHVGV
jgi:hypothetical protein